MTMQSNALRRASIKTGVMAVIVALGLSAVSSVKAWDRFTTLQAGGVAFGAYLTLLATQKISNWILGGNKTDSSSSRAVQPALADRSPLEQAADFVLEGDFENTEQLHACVQSLASDPLFSNIETEFFVAFVMGELLNTTDIGTLGQLEVLHFMRDAHQYLIDGAHAERPIIIEPSAPPAHVVYEHACMHAERARMQRELDELATVIYLLEHGQIPADYPQDVDVAVLLESVRTQKAKLEAQLR